MFAIENIDSAEQILASIYQDRISGQETLELGEFVRGPVGLFLVRDDGANGSKLAEEVMKSFEYWSSRTAHYFDGIFLGWGYDAGPAYLEDCYLACVSDLESRLNWKENGGSHLIITDYVFDIQQGIGTFDFSKGIALDITKLLLKNEWTQLSELIISGLLTPIKENQDGGTWEISDYIAILKLREQFWKELVKKGGALLGMIDGVKDYAVRDLRRQNA
ncbi:MAG: hypothetical protein AAFY78_19620 [Cyanobacteria bacterium J06648_16]